MQQDIEAKRQSEIEMFGGTILALAEKHGVDTPVNRLLYEKIKAIESTY
jgi:2-dehydropantoate 2-reductase